MAFVKGLFLVGHDPFRVGVQRGADPETIRAGAERVVEREHPGRELVHREPADRTGASAGEHLPLTSGAAKDDEPVPETSRELDRFGEPALLRGSHLETVDHDLDRVLLILLEPDLGTRRPDLDAVDDEPSVARLAQLIDHVAVLALLRLKHGGEQVDLLPASLGLHRVDDPVHRLRSDLLAVVRTVRHTDSREEQTQVIVDLRDRSDRRARVLAAGPLLDRDRRRESVDGIDVGLVHLAQELARVRREALDVPSLSFGVKRVECEGGLSGPAHSGDNNEFPPGEVDRDVLQVVLARAADPDGVGWVGHVSDLGRQQRAHRLDEPVEDVSLHASPELGGCVPRIANDALGPIFLGRRPRNEGAVPVLDDGSRRAHRFGSEGEHPGSLEESRVAIGGRGIFSPQFVDEIVVAQHHHTSAGVRLGCVVARLAKGRHVTAFAVTGEDEDTADSRTGELAENSLDVPFELAHR